MNQKDASNLSCQPQSRWATRSSMLADLRGFSEQRWIAFEMVYKPLLLFWIRKKNVPSNGVDDVLQDSWISVAKGIGSFDKDSGKGTFRGWLRTIVQRRVADYFRSLPEDQGIAQEVLDAAVAPQQKDPSELEGEEQAMREVKARATELVRSQTQEKTWQMFWKSTVEGVPTAEIAEEFGVSTAAVRVAKKRVKNRLQEAMIDG
ncbi:sigma-70 family RNA polymerase sigma factor [bacterium]|nr:sigma-70 family RNA polymerase sigma factor [bacterium]MDB4640382.1 sigma-70 family RNA polymerase sigma factor [Pirellulaceae bacterium]